MENMMMYDVAPFLEAPVGHDPAPPVGNIGSILLEQGCLTAGNVEQILRLQSCQRLRFGEAGQRLGLLIESDIQHALALQFRCTYLRPGHGEYSEELIAAYQPFSSAADTLRGIRSQLVRQAYGSGLKTLAIVGVEDTDRSSVFAANLAIVFSQLDKHTLLIDANLRWQRQQAIFKTGPRLGLADVLAGRASAEAIIPVNPFAGLSLLPAGTIPPNPEDLLGRGRFREFHASLLTKYDLILIDTCGFGSSAEAMAIASRLDGAIVIARKDQTRFRDIAATGMRLKQAGVALAGSILMER